MAQPLVRASAVGGVWKLPAAQWHAGSRHGKQDEWLRSIPMQLCDHRKRRGASAPSTATASHRSLPNGTCPAPNTTKPPYRNQASAEHGCNLKARITPVAHASSPPLHLPLPPTSATKLPAATGRPDTTSVGCPCSST